MMILEFSSASEYANGIVDNFYTKKISLLIDPPLPFTAPPSLTTSTRSLDHMTCLSRPIAGVSRLPPANGDETSSSIL